MGWLRLLAQDYAFVQSRSRGGDLLGHGPRYDSHSTRADHSTAMASKIEARRFSGKPGTWAHYEMAVKAHLAVVDLIDFLHNGDGLVGDPKAEWVKGQQKIYSHLIHSHL